MNHEMTSQGYSQFSNDSQFSRYNCPKGKMIQSYIYIYPKLIKIKPFQRLHFTPEEDAKIKILVDSGATNWNYIATQLLNRTARQCRERYNNYLRPELVNGPWTKEEDELLKQLFETHGPKWALIAQHFKSRSSLNIKNRYSSILNQKPHENQ